MGRPGIILNLVLDCLDLDVPLIPIESPYAWLNRKSKKFSRKRYQENLWRLKKKGLLQIVEKRNKKFLKLTKKGQLEKLLHQAQIHKGSPWDGKWRVLTFD